MDSVYRGWGGEPQAGSSIHLNRKAAIVCSLKCTDIYTQFTCQAGTVTDSSLIPIASVTLLVRPRSTTHSKVDCHEFTGSQKWCRSKRTRLFVALPLVCLDSAGVWLSCQTIIWISVFAGLFQVFANQVTYRIEKNHDIDCSIRVFRSLPLIWLNFEFELNYWTDSILICPGAHAAQWTQLLILIIN